eukprot:5902132-Prymnesium_polylepis.1
MLLCARAPAALCPPPFAAAVGASLPVQSAFNARLASHVGGARRASVSVCAIGSVVLWCCVGGARAAAMLPPPRRSLWEVPPWECAARHTPCAPPCLSAVARARTYGVPPANRPPPARRSLGGGLLGLAGIA